MSKWVASDCPPSKVGQPRIAHPHLNPANPIFVLFFALICLAVLFKSFGILGFVDSPLSEPGWWLAGWLVAGWLVGGWLAGWWLGMVVENKNRLVVVDYYSKKSTSSNRLVPKKID